ncbi:MAG: hypothetical protein IJ168_05875 [Eubacterium sp.]|nr:hypothetical protein [Eubacterium sp.]
MKKRTKTVLVILAAIVVFSVVWHFTVVDVTYRGNNAVRHFYEVYGDSGLAPEKRTAELVAELGDCERYSLTLRRRLTAIWTSYGMALVGTYNEENYQKQKEYMTTHYVFAGPEDTAILKFVPTPDTAFSFDINRWHFRILKEADGAHGLSYYYIPEVFRMVAFNDTEYKIAFLTFGDQDQDCFGEHNDEDELQEFVNNQFSYHFKK